MNTNLNKMKKCELIEYCKKLEEEDKKVTNCICNMDLKIKELEEENDKLNFRLKEDHNNELLHKRLIEENEKLKEEKQKLRVNNIDKQFIIDFILNQEQNKELKEKYDSVLIEENEKY